MGGILGVLFPVVDITHPTRREIYNAADMSTGGIVAIIYGLVLGAWFRGPLLVIALGVFSLKICCKLIVIDINQIDVVIILTYGMLWQ